MPSSAASTAADTRAKDWKPGDGLALEVSGMDWTADGKLALLRVEYRPWAHEVDIAHTPKPDQKDLARTFIIEGMARPPKVTLNGKAAEARPAGQGFAVPLT